MADAFVFSQAQFQRILSNFLGLEGAIRTSHILTTAAAVRCVCSRRGLSIPCRCAQCSGGTRLHTMRSAMFFRKEEVQNGVTDATADGRTYDADVVYFDPSSRARVILEVSIVTIGSGTSLGRGARAGLDGV